MNKQKIIKIYIASKKEVEWITIQRYGKFGFSEHSYNLPTKSTSMRFLNTIPIKPAKMRIRMSAIISPINRPSMLGECTDLVVYEYEFKK